MPSFVCDYCQETLKKAKLDQHAQRCRQAVFSCIDCHTNFKGTEYKAHFSCITEVQKYHNKQTVEKSGVNNGKKSADADVKKSELLLLSIKTSTPTSSDSEISSAIKKLFSSASKEKSKSLSFKVVKKQLKKSLGKKSKKTLQEQLKFSFNQQTGELVIKLE